MQSRTGVAINHVGQSLTTVFEFADAAAKLGVESLWLSQLPGHRDVTTLLGGLAARVPDVRIGTAILPVYTYPPVVTAQVAITLDELSGHRFTLGLGVGHRIPGEWMLGAGYHSSVDAMREYISIVRALLTEGEVAISGGFYQGNFAYMPPRNPDIPIYCGSLGPKMIELAASIADGVLLWLCPPDYIHDVVMPSLRRGWDRRSDRGKGFTVCAIVPAAVTTDQEAAHNGIQQMMAGYMRMENYRRLFSASGFAEETRAGKPSVRMIKQIAAIGDQNHVHEQMRRYRDAGASDLIVAHAGEAASDMRQFISTVETVCEVQGLGPTL